MAAIESRWTVGNIVRKARREARLEQEELAKLVGVSRATVSNWERDVHVPSVTHYIAIARITNAQWMLSEIGFNPGSSLTVLNGIEGQLSLTDELAALEHGRYLAAAS